MKRLLILVATVVLSLSACGGLDEPRLALVDVLEVELYGEATTNVLANDILVGEGKLGGVSGHPPDALAVTSHSDGRVDVLSLAGVSGDEFEFEYDVVDDSGRELSGTLVVRVLPPPDIRGRIVVEPAHLEFTSGINDDALPSVVSVRIEPEDPGMADRPDEFPVTTRLEQGVAFELVERSCEALTVTDGCELGLTFRPPGIGFFSDSVVVAVDGFEPVTVELSGRHDEASFSVDPRAARFESALVGSERQRINFTLTNTGTVPLSPSARSFSSALTTSVPGCGEVQPGADCGFWIELATTTAASLGGLIPSTRNQPNRSTSR